MRSDDIDRMIEGEEKMRDDVIEGMIEGIDNSSTMIVFITKIYNEKIAGLHGKRDHCKREFSYASRTKGDNMIFVVMDPSCTDTLTWKGGLALYRTYDLYYDFTDDAKLEECVDSLVSEINKTNI